MLFQRLCSAFDLSLREIFLDPAVFIENLMIILGFVDLIQAEGLGSSRQVPAFRIQCELL